MAKKWRKIKKLPVARRLVGFQLNPAFARSSDGLAGFGDQALVERVAPTGKIFGVSSKTHTENRCDKNNLVLHFRLRLVRWALGDWSEIPTRTKFWATDVDKQV